MSRNVLRCERCRGDGDGYEVRTRVVLSPDVTSVFGIPVEGTLCASCMREWMKILADKDTVGYWTTRFEIGRSAEVLPQLNSSSAPKVSELVRKYIEWVEKPPVPAVGGPDSSAILRVLDQAVEHARRFLPRSVDVRREVASTEAHPLRIVYRFDWSHRPDKGVSIEVNFARRPAGGASARANLVKGDVVLAHTDEREAPDIQNIRSFIEAQGDYIRRVIEDGQ